MDGVTRYLNTDLDLTSADDLTALAAAFEVRGFALMRPVTQLNDGQWFCGFSMGGMWYDEPEPNIAAMLTVIEALDPPLRSAWLACSLRMFDIGYNCGQEPFGFNQGLSTEILGRMAAAGASLRVTLYPDREIRSAEPDAAADRGGMAVS
jgi:hypothetical protein